MRAADLASIPSCLYTLATIATPTHKQWEKVQYMNITFISCPFMYPLGFFLYKIVRLSEQRFHFI